MEIDTGAVVDGSAASRRRARSIGLVLVFPVGYWLAPWVVKTVRTASLSQANQNRLLFVVATCAAFLWNAALLLVALWAWLAWIVMGGFENGYLGQDMQEQSAVKGCLRQVRDGELATVDECTEYARANLAFDVDKFEGLSSPADKLCIASLAHLRHGYQWYGSDAAVIPELTDEATADCTDVRINANDVVTAARRVFGNDTIVNGVLQNISQ